jgi:prepilin-type N-terminal cleavage/methylation domain-containing protein
MKNKAFTLIETLIGITLITVVLTAVTGLVLNTMLSNQRNLHSVQAMAFAQEGVEAMRYLRDSNWRQNFSWDKDFTIAEDTELFLADENCPPCWDISSFEQDGIVTTANGFEFLRRINLRSIEDEENAVEVNVTMEWDEKNVVRTLELSSILSNWQ